MYSILKLKEISYYEKYIVTTSWILVWIHSYSFVDSGIIADLEVNRKMLDLKSLAW